MKLTELLKALSCNKKLVIALMDKNNRPETTIIASKYEEMLAPEYRDMEVSRLKVTSPATVAIYFDEVEEEVEAEVEELG